MSLYFDASKGQALVESLILIPFFCASLSSIALLFLCTYGHLIAHQGVYESALCLEKENPLVFCKKQLQDKIESLPLVRYKISHFFRTPSRVLSQMDMEVSFVFSKTYKSEFRRPLGAHDLKRAQ